MRPIDADALVDGLDENCGDLDLQYNSEYAKLVHYIYSQPTLDYEPVRHGEWIPLEETQWNCFGLVTIGYRCSECGREESHNNEPYCHCGAKMRKGDA